MKQKQTLMEDLNLNNIFVKNDFTYFEYVNQLNKMQEIINKRVFKHEYHPVFRIDDARHELKKKSIRFNLTEKPEFGKAIANLKLIEKELAISSAGKKAEDRVDTLLNKYVKRTDYINFRGIYLVNDDKEDTEIDSLILTKNGIILLEIKNIKNDVTISEEGRLFIGNDCSYEQTPLVEKMNRKRRLFKEEIKKSLKAKGVHIDITLDSFIVFNEAYNKQCYVNNRSDEKWCKSNKLPYIINQHTNSVPYSDNEFAILKECLLEFETKKKLFVSDLDFHFIKESISNLVELVEIEEAKIEQQLRSEQNLNKTNVHFKEFKDLVSNTFKNSFEPIIPVISTALESTMVIATTLLKRFN